MKAATAIRAVVTVLGVIVLLLLLAGVAGSYYLRSKYAPALSRFRQDTARSVETFCAEEAKLAADPFFQQKREGTDDAGPLLNAWLGTDNEVPAGSPLELPKPVVDSITNKPGTWLADAADVSQLDFSWMAKLRHADRWDTLANAPYRDQPLDWVTMPIPNFAPLLRWSRLRLVQGARNNDLAAAIADVRQLAWLSYRSDLLIGAAIAVSILRTERDAHDQLASPPPEWSPMTNEQLDRFRDVLFRAVAYSNIAASVEAGERARSCNQPPVSRCAALTENAGTSQWLRPLVEEDYGESYNALEQEIARGGCPTQLAQRLWKQTKPFSATSDPEGLLTDPRARVPIIGGLVASHVGGILLATALPRVALAGADGGTP